MATETRVQPFYCGSQKADWEFSNCDNCQNSGYFRDAETRSDWVWACDIQKALGDAFMGDGTVTPEIAQRMNCTGKKLNWMCGELNPVYSLDKWFGHHGMAPQVNRPLWWKLRETWRDAQKFWIPLWAPKQDIYGDMGRIDLRTSLAIGWAWNKDAQMVKPGWVRPALGEPLAKTTGVRANG